MSQHLSADDLDQLRAESLDQTLASHLATCRDCRTLAAADRSLVDALEALPTFEPAPGFADRVVAKLSARAATTAVAAQLPARASAARRRILVAGSVSSLVLGFSAAWAATQPVAALQWSGPLLRTVEAGLWNIVQSIEVTVTSVSWFQNIESALATPVRVILLTLVLAAIYGFGLAQFRRILSAPVIDANP